MFFSDDTYPQCLQYLNAVQNEIQMKLMHENVSKLVTGSLFILNDFPIGSTSAAALTLLGQLSDNCCVCLFCLSC